MVESRHGLVCGGGWLGSRYLIMSDLHPTLKLLAIDLSKDFPRSPRAVLGGFVVAGRTLDKCRAAIAGTLGEYHFDCPLDGYFFDFSGITAADFKEFVATGATDEEVGQWIQERSKVKDSHEIIQWNNKMRSLRPVDLPMKLQEFLEGYIPKFVPRNRPVYVWFDVYDLEEHRI